MKDRLIGFIKTYCLFVCIFVLQKPLFMLFYKSLYPDASCADWFSVIWHGLPLDLSLAGYLTAIPGFLFITSVWTLSKSLHRIWCGYFLFISVLISIIFTVDLGLYEYWGFRLDATPLFYFFSSPKDAVASVSIWMVLGGIVAMAVYAVVLYAVFYGILLQKKLLLRMKLPYRRLKVSGILLLMTVTKELLEKVKEKGVNIAHVTLHVGLGTFRPVKVDDVESHHMHSEFYIVEEDQAKLINDTKKAGKRVIAVGTTSCRTLESATGEDGILKSGSGWTEIFIYPGYHFKMIDALITNFHLPESTLVMLVSALAGKENIMHAYETAVQEKYRFFSFGDAMIII